MVGGWPDSGQLSSPCVHWSWSLRLRIASTFHKDRPWPEGFDQLCSRRL